MNTEIKNLMFDLAENHEIFDAEQNRVISKAEANEVLRRYCFEELGIDEKATPRQMKRALESEAGKKLFQVIEEIVDREVTTGWNDSEFFQDFVETRSIADGDRTDFFTTEDIILTVANVNNDHHDMTIQRLNEGKPFQVTMSTYGMKVGGDIRLFMTGRKDWDVLVDAIATAFKKQIMDEMYAEFMAAGSKIPPAAQFNKTGALASATKDTFDMLIEDVQTANNGASVVIMGTRTALNKIQNLIDVDWISNSQKEAVAGTGLLGYYQGVPMIVIPQRFANNDTATKLVDNTVLYVMPQVDLKPVKFVDGGETSIEVNEKGDYMDDMQTLEVQRKMGIATIITKYFGTWHLA